MRCDNTGSSLALRTHWPINQGDEKNKRSLTTFYGHGAKTEILETWEIKHKNVFLGACDENKKNPGKD